MKKTKKIRVVDPEQPGVVFELELEGDSVKSWKTVSKPK